MRHVFTTREKVLLVILAVLVIAVGYWKLILTPINDSIADLNAQTASEQDAILTNSARLSRMRQMQQELAARQAEAAARQAAEKAAQQTAEPPAASAEAPKVPMDTMSLDELLKDIHNM